MKGYIILFGLILSISSLFGQTNKECKQILKKEISMSDMQEKSIDQFVIDFQTLVLCEFDSIDFQIFMGPQGNMPLIAGSVLALGMNPDKTEQKFTFNDLKEMLEQFKQQDEYFQARQIVEAKNEIIQREAKIENWDTDKELLIKMGFTKDYLNDIQAIVRENESILYSDIFIIYSDTLTIRKERQAAEKGIIDSKLKNNNPEREEWIKGLYAYKDYELGLQKSNEQGKPVLFYFNGYACVNSRRIESEILLDKEVQDYINSNLIFISLIIDDRKKLDEDDIYYSEVLNKEVKTIGQFNIELEIKKFETNTQPLFVLTDLNDNEISRIEFTKDKKEFMIFLRTIKE